jgi:hypothetical protein
MLGPERPEELLGAELLESGEGMQRRALAAHALENAGATLRAETLLEQLLERRAHLPAALDELAAEVAEDLLGLLRRDAAFLEVGHRAADQRQVVLPRCWSTEAAASESSVSRSVAIFFAPEAIRRSPRGATSR